MIRTKKMEIYLQPLLNKSAVKAQLPKIKVHGLLSSVPFQKSKWCALKLCKHLPHKFTDPEIDGMCQVEWQDYLERTRRHVGGRMWISDRPVAIFIGNNYIGTDVDFLKYISERYVFSLPLNSDFYEKLIVDDWRKLIESPQRKFVYFTLIIDGEMIGSLLFMLYIDSLPRTCKYFLDFCTSSGPQLPDGRKLSYRGTSVHRIVKNRWIQMGDLGVDDTIDGVTVPDECYCISHDRRGVLSLAKSEKHRNGPQFVVSLNPNPWMNKYYVAFGQLINGNNTLREIEAIPTYYESPQEKIVVSECGEYCFGPEPVKSTDTICRGSFRGEDTPDLFDLQSHDSYLDSDITH